MRTANIQSKKFLETMMLPEAQRREVLEKLGAKLMKQLKVEEPKADPRTVSAK